MGEIIADRPLIGNAGGGALQCQREPSFTKRWSRSLPRFRPAAICSAGHLPLSAGDGLRDLLDEVFAPANFYVAPSLETGPYSAAPVDIDNGDLAGFRSISDNVWPQPTMHDGSGAGINIVGSYKTATQWEAYVQVDHDQFKDVTLSSSYMITLGGTTAGADMSK